MMYKELKKYKYAPKDVDVRVIRLGKKSIAFGLEKHSPENGTRITNLIVRIQEGLPFTAGQKIKIWSFGLQAIRSPLGTKIGYIKRKQILQKV
ncbi:hypothetical protein [Sinomicrobium soli]|uniref:hypothetical protein n=1 Tax=Sinomicrobium sp. N-1-3-6 TaxID=2219864 RepID=UPI000DCE7FFF|nr:hypothetical protein [Sinomicrobium sp. N-1-3-6]RAV29185.1 hypothetical protein DN748_09710 [Sinomicrobium sp. N-1-3-6]